MNPQSDTMPESPADSQVIAPRAMLATRPMYWSVRRELWENRSIYIAPLVVAAVALLGFVVSTIHLPDRRRAVLLLDPARQQAAIEKPYDIVATLLLANAVIVGVFYCLDALHGERRDRSILFWKSLPVSDLTAVLSKASIPLLVLPPLTFVITVATQLIMLVVSTSVLLVHGLATTPGTAWSPLEQSLILLYGFVALALWHAPLYGWLLLVSSWARRATFLWAVLPLLLISALEKIALNSTSITLGDEDINHHYPVNVSKMVISNGSKYSPLVIYNLLIKNILSAGSYQVLINHTGPLKLPDLGSDNKYVSFTLPSHFNMTFRLYPQGHNNIKVISQNDGNISSFSISNNSKVEFYDVKSIAPLKFIPMTLKNPEISVEGHTSIKNSYFDGYLAGSGALNDGVNLDFLGKFKTRFTFTDQYNEHSKSGTRSNYISYLDGVDMIGSTGEKTDALKLPGDIPSKAIKHGDDLPLMKILTSPANVITFAILILATISAIWISKRLKPITSNNN